MPATPGRLSTITDWPRRAPKRSPTRRAAMSEVPPGGNVTISRSGLDGHAWPSADCVIRAAKRKAKKRDSDFISTLEAYMRGNDAPAFGEAHPGLHLPPLASGA